MHRQRRRHGIRGPTWPHKANDRAGNAAVRETDWSGSGTNQPSRVSRYMLLAPALSVGGDGSVVKRTRWCVSVVRHVHTHRPSVEAQSMRYGGHHGMERWGDAAGK